MIRTARGRAILAAAGLVTVALSTAGCSAAAPAAESKKLTVWFPGNNPDEIEYVTDTVVPAFEEEHDAEVEILFVGWGDLDAKLSSAFAGGTAPDVFGHGVAAAGTLADNDRLLDLTSYVDAWDAADRDDLASVLAGGQIDGRQYLVSLTAGGQLLAYDKADFAAAGLNEAEVPETWEELRAIAEELTVREGDTIVRSGLLLPSKVPTIQQAYATLVFSAGGTLLSADNATATVDSAESVRALDFFVDLYHGADPVSGEIGAEFSSLPPAEQPLVTDKAAIQMVTATIANKVREADPDLDLGFIPPLRFESGGTPAAWGGAGVGLMINRDTRVPDLAWEFVDFMVSPETSEGYGLVLGAVPNRTSVADRLGQDNPVIAAWSAAGPYWAGNPNIPGWVQVRDTMDKQVERALNAVAPPETVATEMAADINELLAANE